MRLKKKRYIIIMMLVTVLLSACNDSGMSDLDNYVRETKARKNPKVPPIPAFMIAPSYIYPSERERDPFSVLPLGVGGTLPLPPPPLCTEKEIKEGKEGCGVEEEPCNRPNRYHIRTDLEHIPLDALKMIGTLQADNQLWVLVAEKSTNTVYRVQQGDYMGQNYGQVINVTEDRIELQEQYPDTKGCYSEQATELPLNDKK
jgi:type IV pilus assembly protein PilP